MKRLFTLSIIAVLFAASCSFGAVQDFELFTLDVPSGWVASQNGSTTVVARDDNTAAVSISFVTEEGKSVEDIAKACAKEFNASDLKPTGDGDYTFSFITNGLKSECLVSGSDGVFALIVMTGDELPTMKRILESFKLK